MVETETCFNCVYSHWDRSQIPWCLSMGHPVRPTCANHPDSPGRMRTLDSGRVCRNYRPRPATPEGDVKQIPVGEGLVAYVDTADFEWLNQWIWHVRSGYAVRHSRGKTIYMHREIVQPPDGMIVDHLNHNKLDNTRANLRNCTHRENAYNSAKRRGTASRFRGVRRVKNRDRWYAMLRVEGKPVYLGRFAEEADAARAYDRAAVEHLGDSACLSFPEEWPPERRQQIHSQHAAANGSVGATHASPSPGKGKSATGSRPGTEARGRREDGTKNERKKVGRKEGKTDKAKRRTPAKRKTPAAKPPATKAGRHRRSQTEAPKKPAAERKTKQKAVVRAETRGRGTNHQS